MEVAQSEVGVIKRIIWDFMLFVICIVIFTLYVNQTKIPIVIGILSGLASGYSSYKNELNNKKIQITKTGFVLYYKNKDYSISFENVEKIQISKSWVPPMKECNFIKFIEKDDSEFDNKVGPRYLLTLQDIELIKNKLIK